MSRPLRMMPFILALCILVREPAPAQQQHYLKPNQTADLHDPKLVVAKQACANWGLAAGLETLLAAQKVALDQNFWVMRLSYGELCLDKLPSFESLVKIVSREFTLEDGRRARVELRIAPGAPTTANIDDMLARLKNDQPSLLLWRGHPYYLVGATYDENISSAGARFFEVKELRLADTFAGQPAVAFQKGRDNPDELDGILSLRVTQL